MAQGILGFCFYKVVAAAAMSVLSHLLIELFLSGPEHFRSRRRLIKSLPILVLLVLVNVYILFKIPAMTQSIFSGHAAVMIGGIGIAAAFVNRGLMSEGGSR